MYKYIFQRVIKAFLTILAVLLFVFIGARLTGDPISVMFPDGLTDEVYQQFLEKYGLDQPMLVQLQVYVENIFKGDFGYSILENRPVIEIYAEAAIETLKLGFFSFFLSIILGLIVGILASIKPDSKFSKILMIFVGIGYSTPGFIIAIILILIFSYHLQILPSMGMGSAASYIMPVIAMSVSPSATLARFVYNGFLEVLTQEYIRTARAKGLGQQLRVMKHALRNTLLPLVTVIGMIIMSIISGSLFIEIIFSWPGVGKRLIESVMNADFPVIQFGIVAFSFVVIIVNLLVDILYGVIDPRIRRRGGV